MKPLKRLAAVALLLIVAGSGALAQSAYDLKYYADVFATIDSIYRQELNRPADMGGLINWFWHIRENGRTGEWVREAIRNETEWHHIHDKPQPQELPRLMPAGAVFRKATGERFTVIEASDFNLFGRYLTEGEDVVREVMAERSAVGFNMLRVWSAYEGGEAFTLEIGRLQPGAHASYYTALSEFLDLASAYNLYVELTAFTGPGIPGHWERLGVVAQQHSNILLELVNEHNAHPSINLNDYRPIAGVLCSRGSNGSQSVPVRPWWDYEIGHFNDAFQWPRKVGHNAWEFSAGAEGLQGSGKPVFAGENTRPDRDGNLNHFYDAAAGAALLAGGSTFHSQSGKKSALFGQGPDRRFAEAWVAGARSVPLACQDGYYQHRADLEASNAGATGERVYQRGNDPACVVRIRP